MTFAYPEDELRPLSCRGQGRDYANPGNYARNDVNGDYSLTYLDLLSTMRLMRGEVDFIKAIDRVLQDVVDFDRDVKVQVFEGEHLIISQSRMFDIGLIALHDLQSQSGSWAPFYLVTNS
jgi:hypothetical protein